MSNARKYGKPLLWLHLFVCLVWLMLFRGNENSPSWTGHVIIWSILAVQFSWGFTVGLIVGPSKSRRSSLWWSLLTLFMPLWPISWMCTAIAIFCGPVIAAVYVLAFTIILACETFCGVLLGVKLHSKSGDAPAA